VQDVGPKAEPLGRVNPGTPGEHVVVVRQGNLLATSFHPELTGDLRLHAYFCEQVARSA
jgi:5'-phosphate synthase pdxT subunit